MSTIKDIAKLAGVSKSTVSRVLTGNGYVNAQTRERIVKIMEEQGFQPSSSARSLCTSRTNTIGVIVPEISNSFYSEILEGISKIVDERDLTIIYCNTDNNEEKEEKALRTLIGQRVNGMIYAPAVDYSMASSAGRIESLLDKISAPVVILDRYFEGSGLDSVLYDNYGAGYAAAETLIKAGNRTIGCITGDMKLGIARDRYKGFVQALRDYSLPLERKYIRYGDFTMDTAYKLSSDLLGGEDIPDAVMTSNNMTTIGMLRAARDRGMQFGREFAFIGIDHIEVLDLIGYKYSCVDRDVKNMGQEAMKLLLDRMDHPEAQQRSVLVPYRIQLRGSEKKEK